MHQRCADESVLEAISNKGLDGADELQRAQKTLACHKRRRGGRGGRGRRTPVDLEDEEEEPTARSMEEASSRVAHSSTHATSSSPCCCLRSRNYSKE